MVLYGYRFFKNKRKTFGKLRPFLQFAHIKNENNEIIYNQIFPNVRKRPNPHIYTEEEVLILIEKCKELYSPDQLRIK